MMQFNKRSAGFTLIEVLVASIILFSAISLAAVSFSLSNKSIETAHSFSRVQQARFFIKELIMEVRRTNPSIDSGSGMWGGLSYVWSIKPAGQRKLQYGSSILPDEVLDTGMTVTVYAVEIEVDGKEFEYEILEIL